MEGGNREQTGRMTVEQRVDRLQRDIRTETDRILQERRTIPRAAVMPQAMPQAGQQMADDHELARRLQVQEMMAPLMAARRAVQQEMLERQRVMLERRRAATLVALTTNTAEVVHKSTPKQGEGDGQQDQCSVCMEQFQDGEQLRLLPCMHKYHKCCIDEWFNSSPACPVCKHSIIPSASTASGSQAPVVID